MSVSHVNPKVDFYFDKESKWQKEIIKLRKIVLECQVNEELKWGCPCYTFQNNNVVLIHTFKEYCALLFFKGALLGDPENILIQQSKNVQAARQIRFTNVKEIIPLKNMLKAYIYEAIEIEKSGLKVELKKTEEFDMPDEFKNELKATPSLKTAFNNLTPGRQRAYLLYFSAPKQSKTRLSRIEKYKLNILKGKGLND
jgi:uncharacterized protein YdeI (YjbR/CyaY-like superfamily)